MLQMKGEILARTDLLAAVGALSCALFYPDCNQTELLSLRAAVYLKLEWCETMN